MKDEWLLVCLDFPPQVGGIQTYLAQLARRMGAVRVLAPESAGEATFPFPVERVQTRGAWAAVPALGMKVVRALLRHECAGVLLGHPKLAPLAPLVQGLFGRRAAIFTYGMDVTSGRFKALERAGLRRAWRVITISRYTQQLLVDLGISSERIRLVAPGVDPTPPPGERPAGQPPVLLTVGRVEESEGYKGHDRVLEALPELLTEFPDLQYVVAGGGSGLERLAHRVRAMGLEHTVRIAGWVPPTELATLYSGCDIFVMPARVVQSERGALFEGFGIAYLEAAMHGRPVVAGRAGGAVDAVVDRETGLLVDPEDPRDIARAIRELLKDPAQRRRMGVRGRTHALAHSWEASAVALAAVLGEAGGL